MKILKEDRYAEVYEDGELVASVVLETNNPYQMLFCTVIPHQENQHWPCTIEMSINKEMFVSYEVASKNSLKNNLLPEERNKIPEQNETDDNPDNDLEEIVEMFPSIPGFSECDREETESWPQNDIDDLDSDEMSDEEEDECGNIPSENESGPSNKDAYTALTTAMASYEKQTESGPTQLNQKWPYMIEMIINKKMIVSNEVISKEFLKVSPF
uniref:Uncharacterized protein n=1 Tax=Timema poppense TaxID=170557 RepID=A0A7R9D2F9_TIMPO|nr:unnamed protein product [Timema poppensis]